MLSEDEDDDELDDVDDVDDVDVMALLLVVPFSRECSCLLV